MSEYEKIVGRTPIEKGWSGDLKYRVSGSDGQTYFLRVTSNDRYERKLREYETMQRLARLGISMCIPIEFGTCEEGVYLLQSWIDGEDAEKVMSQKPLSLQYEYGLEAGRFLAKIHSIPAPLNVPNWEERFRAKMDRKIAMYEACELKYEVGGDAFLEYLNQNRHLLRGRPQCFQHGDYHIGNMMIDSNGKLTVIDFDRSDYGDPWEEFNRIVWSAQACPCFAAGMVDAYFDGRIPTKFWDLLALYICSNTLSSLPWAIPFGEGEIQVMRRQAKQVLEWYDGMKRTEPSWYREKGAI